MKKIELALFLFFAILLFKIDFSIDKETDFYFKDEDIYFEYQAAKQIHNNENPYMRILESNMVENDKYATQLPLYFYTLAAIRNVSNDDFDDFVDNYRVILYAFHLLGGVFIYLFFRRSDQRFLGVSAAFFYVFNVWSLNSFIYLKQDMIAIALLLGSFYLFHTKKHRSISYLLFGLSLGIKHIGIFAAPLYLTPLIFEKNNRKESILNLLLLVATVILPSLPFFINHPESFIKSMLFSLTRSPETSDVLYGYNDLLVKYNVAVNTGTLFQQMLPRFPLLVASILAAALLFMKKIPDSTYLFVSILVFAVFNPVIFPQYITWIPPLALISLVGFIDSKTVT